MKLSKPAILILIGILLTATAVTYALYTLTIPTAGIINVPVSLTASPASIDWGTLDAGQVKDIYVNLTNNGGTATQPLTVTANPTVGTLISNATNKVISAHSWIIIDFRLTVSAEPPTGAFNFDITITS
jgi:hypothetical protein